MAVIEEIIEDGHVDKPSHTETASSLQDTATKKINDLNITASLEKLELSEDEVSMTLLIPVGTEEAAAEALYQNLPPSLSTNLNLIIGPVLTTIVRFVGAVWRGIAVQGNRKSGVWQGRVYRGTQVLSTRSDDMSFNTIILFHHVRSRLWSRQQRQQQRWRTRQGFVNQKGRHRQKDQHRDSYQISDRAGSIPC